MTTRQTLLGSLGKVTEAARGRAGRISGIGAGVLTRQPRQSNVGGGLFGGATAVEEPENEAVPSSSKRQITYEGTKMFPIAWEQALTMNDLTPADGKGQRSVKKDKAKERNPSANGVAQSAAALCFVQDSQNWMIHHESPFYKVWGIYMLLCVVITLAALPLELAFFSASSSMAAITTSLDLSFAVDILINFRLTFEHPMTGVLVDNPTVVFRKYFKSLLIPDILSIIPFDYVFGQMFQVTNKTALAVAQALGFFRFLRMRRIMHFFYEMERIDTELIDYNAILILKFLVILLFDGHTTGCVMWWFASLRKFNDGTWIGTTDDDACICEDYEAEECECDGGSPSPTPMTTDALILGESIPRQYLICLYWAFTTITTVHKHR